MPKGSGLRPPWKKGESGNPNGRPRKLPELKELMAAVLGDEKEGITAAEAILQVMRAKAAKGDINAASFLFGYAFPKPRGVEEEQGELTVRIIREER